jgi:hypothetical protein
MLREALVKVCYSLLFSTLQHFVKLPLSSNFRPKGDIQRATSLRPDRTDFRRIAKILTNPNSCTAGRRCRSDLPLKSPLLAICDGSKNRAQQ